MSSSEGTATGAPASPERPASTSPPPPGGDKGGAGPSPLVIGKSFIKQYYKVLSSSPEHIHKFYKSTSCISHGLEPSVPATTITLSDLDDISDVKSKLFSWAEPADDGSVVTLDFERGAIDAQVSVGGGILLVVTGVMTMPGSSAVGRPFVHTFFLNSMAAGKRKQYYVHNDVLRFLSEADVSPEAQEEAAVEVGVEEVAPAVAAVVEVEAESKQVAEEVEAATANGATLPGLAPMTTDGALVGEVPPAAQNEPVVPVPPVAIEPVIPIEREEAVPEMKDGEEAPPALEEEEEVAAEEVVAPAVPEAQDRPEPAAAAEVEEPVPAGGGKPPKQGGRGDRRQKKRSGKRGGANSRSSSPTEKAQQDGGKASPEKSDKEETPTQADAAAPPKQPQAAPVPAPAPAPAPPPTPPKPKTPGSWASLVAGGPQPASPMSQPPAPTPASLEKEDDAAGGAEETKTDKGAEETKAGEESMTNEKPSASGPGGAGAPQRRDQRVPPRSARHRPQSTERAGGQSGGRVPNATLFIKNIPDSTKESDIRGLFEPQAARTGHRILSITLNPNRGFCFVDFDGPEAVATVLKENISSQVKDDDGRITSTAFMVNGRILDVEKKTGERRGGGGGGGRSYHRSASPGNGMGGYKGRGGHPRRTSPRGGGGGRRSSGGR